MTNERINKLLSRPIRKNKQYKPFKKKWNTIPAEVKKIIMTNPERRLSYFKEFYDATKPLLIERIVIAKTENIHQQLINNMRSLVDEKKIELSVEDQIDFNDRLEDALREINVATLKNYFLRNLSAVSKTDKLLTMYFKRQQNISIGDKAKIRARVNKLKKDELLAKTIAKMDSLKLEEK